jgi:hypothetical protein
MEHVMEISGASGVNELMLAQGRVLLTVARKSGVCGLSVHGFVVVAPPILNATVAIRPKPGQYRLCTYRAV